LKKKCFDFRWIQSTTGFREQAGTIGSGPEQKQVGNASPAAERGLNEMYLWFLATIRISNKRSDK
jgi:hypothetical protein